VRARTLHAHRCIDLAHLFVRTWHCSPILQWTHVVPCVRFRSAATVHTYLLGPAELGPAGRSCRLSMLAQIMAQPCFNSLRTQQQLGCPPFPTIRQDLHTVAPELNITAFAV
jgi:hypothetical protein